MSNSIPYRAPTAFEHACTLEVDKIVQPLKDYFGINYFCFHKLYWNLKTFALQNRGDWLQYFHDNELYKYTQGTPLPIGKKVFLADDLDKESDVYRHMIKPMAEKFDITQIVCFATYHYGATCLYFMGVPASRKNFVTDILREQEYFKQFNFYFLQKAHHLLQLGKEHAVKYPIGHELVSTIKQKIRDRLSILNGSCFNKIESKRFYLQGKFDGKYLTAGEVKCLVLLQNGYNYSEIAVKLKISVRTVHDHINHIKEKLQCVNKTDLIRKIHVYELIPFLSHAGQQFYFGESLPRVYDWITTLSREAPELSDVACEIGALLPTNRTVIKEVDAFAS